MTPAYNVRLYRPFAALAFTALVCGCSNSPQGIRFTNGGTAPTSSTQTVQPIRQFSQGEVKAALSGKTFQYTRDNGNGFVTYNPDGSLAYQDDSLGQGTGRWGFQNGQYCETFGAGAPQECGEFKSTGDAYFAAKSRLVEMKV